MKPRSLALAGMLWPALGAAQGPALTVGRYFADTPRTTYRLGYTTPLVGPVSTDLYATLLQAAPTNANLWGLGADLAVFRGGRSGAYLVGGMTGGVGPGSGHTLWGSWSAGLGYEIMPLQSLSLATEGRWRVVSPGDHRGVEVALRLGFAFGGGRKLPPTAAAVSSIPAGAPDSLATLAMATRAGVASETAELLSAIVQTAEAAMGTPYEWGGTGEDRGFDCSGLIQYAFARHGVSLPRRSVDQAEHGRAVEKSLAALLPGDILTFSSDGDRVTHVGLYVGQGKFIHSASQGVQLSVLSADDLSGRWWWHRWAGVRRVVE